MNLNNDDDGSDKILRDTLDQLSEALSVTRSQRKTIKSLYVILIGLFIMAAFFLWAMHEQRGMISAQKVWIESLISWKDMMQLQMARYDGGVLFDNFTWEKGLTQGAKEPYFIRSKNNYGHIIAEQEYGVRSIAFADKSLLDPAVALLNRESKVTKCPEKPADWCFTGDMLLVHSLRELLKEYTAYEGLVKDDVPILDQLDDLYPGGVITNYDGDIIGFWGDFKNTPIHAVKVAFFTPETEFFECEWPYHTCYNGRTVILSHPEFLKK